jgi:hypothetical protein
LSAPGAAIVHDRRELLPREVRKVLVKDVGLAEADARDLL